VASSKTSSSRQGRGFVSFALEADAAQAAEAALADAFEAGASGAEQRDGADGRAPTWKLYAPAAAAPAVARALAAHAPAVRAAAPQAVPEEDWSERWKRGLRAIEVSPRLRVRPSFVAAAADRAEIAIDPGQAFGTGAHASTRLALELIDALAPRLPAGARVLDVGCGSGVLALAALRLGAARAVGLDLDPLAVAAARANATANALGARLDLVLGPIDALGAATFELVVANLLRSEMLPLLPAIAARTRRSGHAVLSGLLEGEVPGVVEACARVGLRRQSERGRGDASGGRWSALLMRR
jgi:ribosomal protein L11 methyltransferase